MLPYLLVALGGAIGSMLRYGTGVLLGGLWRDPFPLATMLINITGSLIMGLFIGLLARTVPAWQNEARLFIAVGVLGGFTTFSSFSLDTVSMLERGAAAPALLYVGLSVLGGFTGLWLGLLVMRAGTA